MKYNIAIVGATGLVGQTFLKVLEERNFPINKLYLYASARSKGKKINFMNKEYEVIELTTENIKDDIDFALFSAGASTSKEFAKEFTKKGATVIDNSSCFRMDNVVPLVVPEVNMEAINDSKLIANPNCSTIQVIPPLKVLDDNYGIKRIIYSTYQAVSGAGMKGINDYNNHTTNHFPHTINSNLIPQIDIFLDNGYTKEEMKMINETQKILNKKIDITATCVRVPVLNCHSVSINLELEKDFELNDVIKLLSKAENIVVFNTPDYPMPINADNDDRVFVGRIRRDFSNKNSLNLWVVADNIRKGAATNAVQIVEKLCY